MFTSGTVLPLGSFLQGYCQWTPHCKQAVYFFSTVSAPETVTDCPSTVAYAISFNPKTGDVAMDFKL